MFMPFPIKPGIVSALFILSVSPLWGHVALPSFFSDHMVLQRQMKVPVWGTASPGERVAITLNDQHVDAVADANGQWKASLAPMEAGGPYTMTVAGSDTTTINDILVGEVWFFSGQSNMEWGAGYVTNHEQEIPAANFPQIRLCQIPHTVADKPATDVPTSWAACTPDSVFKFSGVAYFTGRELYKKLNVPIGLIQASYSGTNIENWMPQEALASDPDFQPLQDRWAKVMAAYPAAKADFDAKLPQLTKDWQDATAKAKAENKPLPAEPRPPEGEGSKYTPSGLFNGAVAPVAGYGVRGIVWYQGENNTAWAFLYRKELKALITSWRQHWGEGDLPFVVIQLPSVIPLPPTTTSHWAEIRESQAKALELPNTGLVVTIDLGDALHHDNLHPKNKQDVGLRTGLVIEKTAYGQQDVIASGPTFKTATPMGDSIRVQFDNAAGLKTKDGAPVAGFELAGNDNKYVPATGTIDGDSIVLKADGVSDPQTVRYDWANYPDGNLYNGADLPARPFRNDDFVLDTVNAK